MCVDVYTHYAFIKLLKTKSAKNVCNKFEQILTEENESPQQIHCDEGTEFALIKKPLAPKYKFKVFHMYNRETKAVHAERFIQTFKQIICRTLTTLGGGYNYTRYLLAILERYNESPHWGLFSAAPIDLYVHEKIPKNFKLNVLKSMLNGTQPTQNLLHVGDCVRLA